MHKLNLTLEMLSLACLTIAVFFALLATCRFANILTKLVALEVLVNLFICGVAIWALHINFPLLLDICIALSLIMFLTTVAYCQLLAKREIENA